MPTIEGIDSFQHRILPTALAATNGWYSAIGNGGTLPNHGGGAISFDTSIKRTDYHACSLKLVHDNVTAVNVRRNVATTMIVGSIYFRVDAAPTNSTKLINIGLSSGTNSVSMNSSGQLACKAGSATLSFSGANYADAKWHRLDFRSDTTTGNTIMDAKVDGTDLTQSSAALASANQLTMMVGDNSVPSGPGTMYFNDLCWSVTVGDYPLGDHICLGVTINGTGTHNKGTGTWADETGATTDAAILDSVDDVWDGTTPNLTQTGEDYAVKSAGTTATEYLEFLIEDASAATYNVWGAQLGVLMAALDSTTGNTQEARLVDAGGTTLATPGALIDASVSATAYTAYRAYATAAPSGGWASGFNGCRVRWGFTNDVTPNPVFNAAFVEYVGSWPTLPHISMARSAS